MTIKLRPFTVPNYVIAETPSRPRQEGLIEAPKFALEELDASDLDQLCTEFRREIFHKAKKHDPRLGAF